MKGKPQSIEFIIECDPVPQPRERAQQIPVPGTFCNACRRSATRTGTHPVTTISVSEKTRARTGSKRKTKPHPIVAFKEACQIAATQLAVRFPDMPWTGPIRCDFVFVLSRPKAMTKKTKPNPRVWHDKSNADRDNLDKAALDAFKGILWIDDGQVCAGELIKVYAADGEEPHVEVAIRQLEVYDAGRLPLTVLDGYESGTACIRYRVHRRESIDWFISALEGVDNEQTLREHLRKHLPAAEFVGWAIK